MQSFVTAASICVAHVNLEVVEARKESFWVTMQVVLAYLCGLDNNYSSIKTNMYIYYVPCTIDAAVSKL